MATRTMARRRPRTAPIAPPRFRWRCMECPLCGHAWERQPQDGGVLSDFVMTEIDLLKRSNFRWCDLFGGRRPDGHRLQRPGAACSSSRSLARRRWRSGHGSHLLAVGERTVCLAKADDWLNDHESDDSAHKTRRWLNEPPTDKQLRYLPEPLRADFGLTRYQASALLSFQFNKARSSAWSWRRTTAIGRRREMRRLLSPSQGARLVQPRSRRSDPASVLGSVGVLLHGAARTPFPRS